MSVTITTLGGSTYNFERANDFYVDGKSGIATVLAGGDQIAAVSNFESAVIEDAPAPELISDPASTEDPLSAFEIAEAKVKELQGELENWKSTANRRYWAAFGCNPSK